MKSKSNTRKKSTVKKVYSENKAKRRSPKKCSPKKHSPKRRSPKKYSPKRRNPKKHSPKKHSPKKRTTKKGKKDGVCVYNFAHLGIGKLVRETDDIKKEKKILEKNVDNTHVSCARTKAKAQEKFSKSIKRSAQKRRSKGRNRRKTAAGNSPAWNAWKARVHAQNGQLVQTSIGGGGGGGGAAGLPTFPTGGGFTITPNPNNSFSGTSGAGSSGGGGNAGQQNMQARMNTWAANQHAAMAAGGGGSGGGSGGSSILQGALQNFLLNATKQEVDLYPLSAYINSAISNAIINDTNVEIQYIQPGGDDGICIGRGLEFLDVTPTKRNGKNESLNAAILNNINKERPIFGEPTFWSYLPDVVLQYGGLTTALGRQKRRNRETISQIQTPPPPYSQPPNIITNGLLGGPQTPQSTRLPPPPVPTPPPPQRITGNTLLGMGTYGGGLAAVPQTPQSTRLPPPAVATPPPPQRGLPGGALLGMGRTLSPSKLKKSTAAASIPASIPSRLRSDRGGETIFAVIVAKFNFSESCLIASENNTGILPGENTGYIQAHKAGNYEGISKAFGSGAVQGDSMLTISPNVTMFARQFCELIDKTPGITPLPVAGVYFPENKAQIVLCDGADKYLTGMKMLALAPKWFKNQKGNQSVMLQFNWNMKTGKWENDDTYNGDGTGFLFNNWDHAAEQYDDDVYKLFAECYGAKLNPTPQGKSELLTFIESQIANTGMDLEITNPEVIPKFIETFNEHVINYLNKSGNIQKFQNVKDQIINFIPLVTSNFENWDSFVIYARNTLPTIMQSGGQSPAEQQFLDLLRQIMDNILEIFRPVLSKDNLNSEIIQFTLLLIKLQMDYSL